MRTRLVPNPTRASAISVAEVVAEQGKAGIDVVSDGEFGKSISWSQYVLERLSGFERRPIKPGGNPFARGADRAIKAAELAVASPLLEASIDGAHGVLLSISGGSDLGLFEVHAVLVTQRQADQSIGIEF